MDNCRRFIIFIYEKRLNLDKRKKIIAGALLYMKTNIKTEKRARLHKKIRSRISGTESRPRLCVFRSNKFIYAQVIDDNKAITIASASDIADSSKVSKVERAKNVGKKIAENAKAKNITTVVFDRGGFAYSGRIKALADAAREGGLNF